MNRRRNEIRHSNTILFALLLGAAICAGGGILHAYYKNQQVSTNREIDAAESRIEHARLDIRTSEMHMDKLLNRFTIRNQLAQNGSTLRPIAFTSVEKIESSSASRRAVASANP